MSARQQFAICFAVALVVAGVALISWRASLIVAGVLIAALTFVSEF